MTVPLMRPDKLDPFGLDRAEPVNFLDCAHVRSPRFARREFQPELPQNHRAAPFPAPYRAPCSGRRRAPGGAVRHRRTPVGRDQRLTCRARCPLTRNSLPARILGERLAALNQAITSAPAGMPTPPTVTDFRKRRRTYGKAGFHHSAASMALPTRARSLRTQRKRFWFMRVWTVMPS